MKLSLETAKEMYKSDIPSIKQFALDNYTEKELKELSFPKSWEELGSVEGEYIYTDSSICISDTLYTAGVYSNHKNIIPEGLGQSVLDLIQLLQVRDRYREIEGYTSRDYFASNPKTGMFMFLFLFGFSNRETVIQFERNFEEQLISVGKLYK